MADKAFASQSSSFWQQYSRGRPRPDAKFWDRIFDYHEKHSSKFDTVNDLGCGVGIHAPTLAQRFSHVILTEPSQTNIDIAREALPSQPGCSATTFTYIVGGAEQTHLSPSSVDMVFAANSFHFMDPSPAIANIATQLNPGGTCILTIFGIAYFDDPNVKSIYARMTDYAIGEFRHNYGADDGRVDRVLIAQNDGYDAAQFPEDLFETPVMRVKLNTKGRAQPFRQDTLWKKQPSVSSLGPMDKVVEMDDPSWTIDVDLQGIKDIWATYPLGKLDQSTMDKFWAELEAAADENGRYKGVWPVSVVMATKRRDTESS